MQTLIYNTSRALKGVKERYLRAKKIAFALMVTARQLRLYFHAHTIWVLTDQPLRTILHKPETSGKLVKWSVKLSKFDIEYHPQGAIKGQAMAGFITEYTRESGEESNV